jgi:hypothetical protein
MTPVQIPNQMVAFSEFKLQSDGKDTAFLVGELAVLPTELDITRRSLISQGFRVSAINNHSASLFPQLFFLHISKHGDAVQMSQLLRRVIDQNRIAAGQISSTGSSGSGTGSTSGGTTGTGASGGTGTTGGTGSGTRGGSL